MAKKNGNKKSKAIETVVEDKSFSIEEVVSDADLETMMAEKPMYSALIKDETFDQAAVESQGFDEMMAEIAAKQDAENIENLEVQSDYAHAEDMSDEGRYIEALQAEVNTQVAEVKPKAPKAPKLDPCAEYDPMIQAMVRKFPSNEMAWAFTQNKDGTVAFTTADTRAEMCEHLQYGGCDPTKTAVVFTEKHDHNQAIALKKATKMLAKLV